jgi:hypothetical protein
VIAFTGWTFDHIYESLTWPRYRALCKQWSKVPPAVITSAYNVGWKPEENNEGGRKLIETGDPEFPYVYEATPEEFDALGGTFG